jgi:hypothetical protein
MDSVFSEKQQTIGEEIPYILPKRPDRQCTYKRNIEAR